MSQTGLDAAVALLLKGTCGVVVAVAFAVTTRPRDLVRALQHLRVPDTLVTIAGFMVRYVDVVGDQMRRMRVARASRGFTRALGARLAAARREHRARSSSAATSAASGCTSPWSAAAGRAGCRSPRRSSRPAAQWALALAPAAVAAVVSVGVRLG